jgi:UTP:GlnB (protein PII) uridylyltransferase
MIDKVKLMIGSYERIIPEVYELKGIEEQNDWHDENVFDHTIEVLSRLEYLTPCWPELKNNLDTNSRLDILVVSATLHDIGKIKQFEGHEKISAEMAQSILPYFSLSQNEHDRATSLIRYHGEMNKVFKSDNWVAKYQKLIKKVPKLEITLLGLADLKSSRLMQTQPEKYNLRMSRYKEILGEKIYGVFAK